MTARLPKLLCLLACLLLPAIAPAQTATPDQLYYATPGSIGANSPGATIQVVGYFPTAPQKFCFYTGFGSTAPLVGTASTSAGSPAYTLSIPASTIQSIPPASFTSGTFNAKINLVSANTTTCSGVANTSLSNQISEQIVTPTLTSVDLRLLPQHNTNFTAVSAPTELYAFGSGFTSNLVATFTGNGVNFTSPVTLNSGTSLRIDSPIVPAGVTSLNLSLCTNATYTFCTASLPFAVKPLEPNPGTLSATPVGSTYTLQANFGSTTGSVAGVPLGSVSFSDGTTVLGTAPAQPAVTSLVAAATPGTWSSSGSAALTSTVADFNKDGLPDTLVYDPNTPNVLHLLLGADNRGDLANDSVISTGNSSGCGNFYGFTVADFNGDGYPDIAMLCGYTGYGSTIFLYMNQADGTFASSQIYLTVQAQLIAAGDMNKDGKQDLVLAGPNATASANIFTVLLGDGTGAFPTMKTYTDSFAVGQQMLVADLNNDGYPDVTILNKTNTAQPVTVFQNDGQGGLPSTPTTVPPATNNGAPTSIAVQQVKGSNPNLIVSALGVNSTFTVLKNSGTSPVAFTTRNVGIGIPNAVSTVVGDFDADGIQDFAYFDGTKINVLLAYGTAYGAALADGTNFSPSYSLPATGITFAGTADFNADGYADILAVSPAGTTTSASARSYITSGTVAAFLTGQNFGPGAHMLTATTPGTVSYAPGTAVTTLNVAGPTTTGSFSISPQTGPTYSPTTYETVTAVLTGSGPKAPGGTVTFTDAGNVLGTVAVVAQSGTTSSASLQVMLSAGGHGPSAQYNGDGTYPAAFVGATEYSVTKGTPVLTWTPSPASIPYGTALSSAQLDAVAQIGGTGIPGTYTYTPAAGSVLTAGNQPLRVSFAPTDTVDYNSPIAGSASITVTKVNPVISWNTPAPIVTGTALSSTQLNATATGANNAALAGTFTYNPPAGTVLPAGTTTLNTTFTPTDQADYNTVPASVQQVVNSAGTMLMLSGSPNPSTFGQAVTFTATVTSTYTGATISGTVAFSEGETPLGSAPVNGGLASISTSGLSVGPHTITARYSGDTTFSTSFNQTSQTVSQASVLLNWAIPAPIIYGTALSGQQLNATATNSAGAAVAGSYAYTPAAGTVLPAGTQPLSVTFTPSDTATYKPVSGKVNLVVQQASPVLTWATPAAIPAGTALSATQLNASATGVNNAPLPGTFTYTPPAGTVLPAGNNPLSVSFTPTDTTDYKTATTGVTQVVNAATISVTLVNAPNPSTYGQAIALTATVTSSNASSGPVGSVTFSIVGSDRPLGSASVINGQASIPVSSLAVGSYNLIATFRPDAGGGGTTSPSVQQVVSQAVPSVTWAAPASIVYGTPLSATQLNATATTSTGTAVAGTFAYAPAAGQILSAGTQTLGVTFTPTDTVNYAKATGQTSLTVLQATPIINWATPAAITAGTPLSGTQLNATANGINGAALPGSFTYTPPAGTVLPNGTSTLSTSFTPADQVDYKTAAATVQQVVNSAVTTTVVSSSSNPSSFGQSVTFTATVTSSYTGATLAGTVTFLDGQTVLGSAQVVSGTATVSTSTLTASAHTITANYAGNQTFSASSGQLTQTVSQGSLVLSWTAPAPVVYGTALSAPQLNASAATSAGATVPGTYTYTPAAGTVLPAGTQMLSVTFNPTDSATYKSVTGSVSLVVSKATPVIAWTTPASVIAGTVLSSTQLNASATGIAGALPGTFQYTPAAGTVLAAGQTVLNVVFTPNDASDYNNASGSVMLTVTGVSLISLSPSTGLLGDPDTLVTLTGTGFAPDAVVTLDGVAASTRYVNGATLTVLIPAAQFTSVHTIAVIVKDPTQGQVTNALSFSVATGTLTGTINGPTTTSVGGQPTVSFALLNPFPVPLTATFNLLFTPAAGLPPDPTVLFANGTTTYTVVLPAGSTSPVPLLIQTGSVQGSITLSSSFSAGGVAVTPAGGAQTLVIVTPPAVPGITSIALTRNNGILTVTLHGYSNIRTIDHINFHFVPPAGSSLSTNDLTIQGAALFGPYFASGTSIPYGSTFTYTQDFNVDGSSTDVAQIQVTLVNSVGSSQTATTP